MFIIDEINLMLHEYKYGYIETYAHDVVHPLKLHQGEDGDEKSTKIDIWETPSIHQASLT